MGIAHAFGKVADWCLEGSLPVSFGKTFLVCVGTPIALFTAVQIPLSLMDGNEMERLEARFADLDNRSTEVFTSVDDCISHDYSRQYCEAARQEAWEIFNSTALRLKYKGDNAAHNCFTRHGECDVRDQQSSALLNYQPRFAGWQSDINDPGIAAPLYNSAHDNEGIRRDGKTFTLDIA